ncbi:MAG: NUDIX hydrolase [Pseudomonadota bacterium]
MSDDRPQDKSGQHKNDQHKNDMYGDIAARSEQDAGVQAPIPAATVVLLRDQPQGGEVEILMLRKNSKITFGGMWVFPGGKIDDEDFVGGDDLAVAARTAAARETQEEAGLQCSPADFHHFAHWTPPPGPGKRFATWFFACQIAGDADIAIDDGEIKEHAWVNPGRALQRHAAGEIDLAPPTWVTLYHLSRYAPAGAVLERLQAQPPKVYSTHVAKRADGVRVAMWHGDAGYEPWDADVPGARHRLAMAPDGFVFDNTTEDY